MNTPRLEIDLDGVRHNSRTLVASLSPLGIGVTGVTKAVLGSTAVAATMLQAGVVRLGDSRIENLEVMRDHGVDAEMMLIRAPLLSQIDRVVASADISCNTEATTIEALSSVAVAAGRIHDVVLMVDLGDRREGVLPADLIGLALVVLQHPGVRLRGIGTNLACQAGVSPDVVNMGQLSSLAGDVEARLGVVLAMVSGGNSANLEWALGCTGPAAVGRINDLRLGESILLGRETLHRRAIVGLRTDVVSLVAEVIESKVKPSQPVGTISQGAFGSVHQPIDYDGGPTRTIVAVGHQDTDPAGLVAPEALRISGASSDHLVVTSDGLLTVGTEVRFGVDYSAMLRAMSSSTVEQVIRSVGASPVP